MLTGNVTEIEMTARLMRYLHESVRDHGGSIAHVNRLLVGHSGNRELLAQVAKLLVGGIWYHVEHSRRISITSEEFACSADEFQTKWPSVVVSGGNGPYAKSPFTESAPRDTPWYRLVHFERPMKFDEILEAIPLQIRAGWRELVAYTATMSPEEFSGCTVIAPGSFTYKTLPDGSVMHGPGFPEAYCPTGVDTKTQVVWHSKKRPSEEKYPTKCFYLVRNSKA